jgi:hypothetical protein
MLDCSRDGFLWSAVYTWVLENLISIIIQQKRRLEAWKVLKQHLLSGSGSVPVLAVYFRAAGS